ncbi:MAG: nucleoside-triphosphatase [Pseudomonadota bacterium]
MDQGRNPPRVLLLTGAPGIGKTTVIRRVAEALRGLKLGGFYTEELREAGKRVGFLLVDFDGQALTLAHAGLPGPRVSKYGVDVAALDGRAQALLAPRPEVAVYLVDEIGKMECLSARFVAAMGRLLASGRPVVASVARKGGGFIAEAKRWPGAALWEVTQDNRDHLPVEVIAWLRQSGVAVDR